MRAQHGAKNNGAKKENVNFGDSLPNMCPINAATTFFGHRRALAGE